MMSPAIKVGAKIVDAKAILQGAYDLHLHCGPDVIRRAQDLVQISQAAHAAGMAGILLKDHTTSTNGRCYGLNKYYPQGPRFISALTLNPPVGGLNPVAVEAALLAGVDVVFFPTYGARNHILRWGAGTPPTAFPLESTEDPGITIFDTSGRLKPEVLLILQCIATHDGLLATGHLSPPESLALLRAAREHGVRRMIVTHASQSVVAMCIEHQREAVALGAWIEHVFFSVTQHCPEPITMENLCDQIDRIGVDHVILSSDFGQVECGPPLFAFKEHLDKMLALGIPFSALRRMIASNPKALMQTARS
jgi:hypothetical protein